MLVNVFFAGVWADGVVLPLCAFEVAEEVVVGVVPLEEASRRSSKSPGISGFSCVKVAGVRFS